MLDMKYVFYFTNTQPTKADFPHHRADLSHHHRHPSRRKITTTSQAPTNLTHTHIHIHSPQRNTSIATNQQSPPTNSTNKKPDLHRSRVPPKLPHSPFLPARLGNTGTTRLFPPQGIEYYEIEHMKKVFSQDSSILGDTFSDDAI